MKICPQCRKQQTDARHILCATCKASYVDASQFVSTLSKEELKVLASFILKDWRVYVVAGVVLVAGMFGLKWQVAKKVQAQVNEIEMAASNQIVAAYSAATNRASEQFQSFADSASDRIAEAYSTVTNQIAAEFQTPRIKGTIEDVAKSEAKSILEAEVKPVVDNFRSTVDQRLDSIAAEQDFLGLATRARANDFRAYLKLVALSSLPNRLGIDAKKIVEDIDRILDAERNSSAYRQFVEIDGTYSYKGPFSSDEIAMRLEQSSVFPRTREAIVNMVKGSKQTALVRKLVEMLSQEDDLLTADRIVLTLSELTTNRFQLGDAEVIADWCNKKGDSFRNWPFKDLEMASSSFSAARYAKAAEHFDQILAFDGTADMSRAMSVLCYWELGETNKAAALAAGFKDPSGRWAQLAAAKAELETGTVSNATVRVHKLIKSFPTLRALPKQGYHSWRKVDWRLMEQLDQK